MKNVPTDPRLLAKARELRQNQTHAEDELWHALRNRKLAGLKFRRQKPAGASVTDFFCDAAKVIVELDGITHMGKEEADARRDVAFERMGCLVLRFYNSQIWHGMDLVLTTIERVCLERVKALGTARAVRPAAPPHPRPLPGGEGGRRSSFDAGSQSQPTSTSRRTSEAQLPSDQS